MSRIKGFSRKRVTHRLLMLVYFFFILFCLTSLFPPLPFLLLFSKKKIMSKFSQFREGIEKAIDTCLSATSEYRQNNANAEPPTSFIESLVTQHILPLTGQENSLQIPIVEGKPDWRKSATELAFRRALIHNVVSFLSLLSLESTKNTHLIANRRKRR